MVSRILMHVGPSVGNVNVLSASTVPNIGFASPEFNHAMKYALEEYAKITGADSSYTPFILPGGGTVAMESTVSFLEKGSRVLIVSNGAFGDRWEKILSRYPVEFKVLRASAGNVVPVSQVKAEVQDEHYDAVTLTHVETSTGARIPLKEMAYAIRPHVGLIIVDGVASVGGERLNAADWNIDICLTASQKALGAQTGAGLLVASEKAVSRLEGGSISSYFLDLRNWLPIMNAFLSGKGGYFATPPVGTIFSLKKSFELIEMETLERRLERHRICSDAFRKGVKEMGLEIVAVLGGRGKNGPRGYPLGGKKHANPGRSKQGGGGVAAGDHQQIKDRYFRVGHMGWIEPANIIQALRVMENSIISLGGSAGKDAALAAKAVFEKSLPLV